MSFPPLLKASVKSPAFAHAAGAIDEYYIQIKASGDTDQKCDDFMSFSIYICAPTVMEKINVSLQYPGLVHDARVVHRSPIFYHAL